MNLLAILTPSEDTMKITELEFLLALPSIDSADKQKLVERHVRSQLEQRPTAGIRLTPRMAHALVGLSEQYELALAAGVAVTPELAPVDYEIVDAPVAAPTPATMPAFSKSGSIFDDEEPSPRGGTGYVPTLVDAPAGSSTEATVARGVSRG